jgi:hypothetical protein
MSTCYFKFEMRDGTPTQSIVCNVCRMESFNPNDISMRYCGNCRRAHLGSAGTPRSVTLIRTGTPSITMNPDGFSQPTSGSFLELIFNMDADSVAAAFSLFKKQCEVVEQDVNWQRDGF